MASDMASGMASGKRLENKAAIVTGGAKGIGRAIAQHLWRKAHRSA